MGFHVPYNYIKLYSSKDQANKTLEVLKMYTSQTDIITDATSGIGGNSILFLKYFEKLNCVEINSYAFNILKENLKFYSNVLFYNKDYIEICKHLKQDVIFLDPPWEINYKNKSKTNLKLSKLNIKDIIENLYDYCKIIALKCPLNFECVVNNWDFTTHYIYKYKKVLYKIIVYHKYV